MRSALHDKLEPLVNLSATAALEEMIKAKSAHASFRGALKPLLKPSAPAAFPASAALAGIAKNAAPASKALDQMMNANCASSALEDMTKRSPTSSALDQMMKANCATSALDGIRKSSPASSALDQMMKTNCATSALDHMKNTSPASSALDDMMQANRSTFALDSTRDAPPASTALDQMMNASRATSALKEALPATAALEESMFLSSSKRVKRSPQETPRRASMTSFTTSTSTSTSRSSTKFDTTDLFQAIEAPDSKEEFSFPSLSWDLGDGDEEEESVGAAEEVGSLGLGKRKHGRSISASCLLGKRPRGLVRSKTMKSEVDRLVSQHQAAFPCLLQAAK